MLAAHRIRAAADMLNNRRVGIILIIMGVLLSSIGWIALAFFILVFFVESAFDGWEWNALTKGAIYPAFSIILGIIAIVVGSMTSHRKIQDSDTNLQPPASR